MRMKVTVPLAVAFLAGCVATSVMTVAPARAAGSTLARWEYTCTSDKEALNAFGAQSWELVTASPGPGVREFCFKRPLEP